MADFDKVSEIVLWIAAIPLGFIIGLNIAFFPRILKWW